MPPKPDFASMSDEEKQAYRKQQAAAKKAAKEAKVAKAKAAKEARARVAAENASKNAKKAKEEGKALRLRSEYVNKTPKGQKKIMDEEMSATYDPPAVEAAWYDWWETQGYFRPELAPPSSAAVVAEAPVAAAVASTSAAAAAASASTTASSADSAEREKFVIVIPPPNVTGVLHLGHALTNAVQDALSRWHRMCGHEVLWVPGTDHAGIATQAVVERALMREENKTRHDLGREEFLKRVWQWKEAKGGHIRDQLRRLGSSLDWTREAFTMDEVRSRAVTEAFVQMYEKGLIYRANRLVNWCSTLNTALSQIEVDKVEMNGPTRLKVPGQLVDGKLQTKEYSFGTMDHFLYPVADSDERLEIATTRLETMLADSAVAVHPEDPRYAHLHGKFVVHPFSGRKLPIVFDAELVDMEKGTGVVKVTPAHDPNDFACGQRHDLPVVNMLNDDGTLNENGLEFAGESRFEARLKVRKALKEKGLYVGSKSNPMVIGVCSRTGDIIEPRIKPQWYVSMDSMSADALEAVESGELKLHPASAAKVWSGWLREPVDWCVSRQLWWGHRIPAFLCWVSGEPRPSALDQSAYVVARSEEEARRVAAERHGCSEAELSVEQDPDVLDTWFSSGLFPFSVMGWPEKTPDLERYFPGALLETGHDILFFWVARMVMMSKVLTGRLPFGEVMLHAMVRDAQGRKMSKALGNVVDPLDVIAGISQEDLIEALRHGNLPLAEVERAAKGIKKDYPTGISECGTDALRFALCDYTTQGRSINLDIKKVVKDRNFCNKLWNAVRFCMLRLPADFVPPATLELHGAERAEERWVLSRLAGVITSVDAAWRSYQIGNATSAIKSFLLNEFCNTYIEASRALFESDGHEQEKAAAYATLYQCLEVSFRLLHPFMPFVTEELWQRLQRRAGDPASIMISPYPQRQPQWEAPEIESSFELALEVVRAARTVRALYQIHIKQNPALFVRCTDEARQTLAPFTTTLISMCGGSALTFLSAEDDPLGCSTKVVNASITLYTQLTGIVDLSKEVARQKKRIAAINKELTELNKRIASASFTKAPEKVQQDTRDRADALALELAQVEAALKFCSELAEKEKQ